jgi:hypothetical protein
MALILYSNGVNEEYRPQHLVFTEDELLHLFSDFAEIKTFRLTTILNTWCIYGNNPNIIQDPMEFNRIASEIIKQKVYSHILFVHDSELNIDWKVTDNILYKSYNEFFQELLKEIEDTANDIMQELQMQEGNENTASYLPQLMSLGTTEDKRIMFSFNPNDQTKEFFDHDEFYVFVKKVYDYITKNKQVKEPFTIYEDKKAIIIVETINIKDFLNSMLEKFKSKEDYEMCTNITKIMKQWSPLKKSRSIKKTTTKNKK